MNRPDEARVIPLRRERVGDAHATPPGEPVAAPREREAPGAGPVPAPGHDRGGDVVGDLVGFLRGRVSGRYEVDEFGFDADLTDTVLMPPFRALYRRWFRVEVTGAGNLPEHGGALLVANHSGTVPLDAVMTALAVHDNHPRHRHLRVLASELVFRTPVLGALARKSGQALACRSDAERLLRSGELVGAWPEGFPGIGKPFTRRYQLQRFGGGFVSAALRGRAPIVPVSIVGAEETYPKLADVRPLARLLGLPYFPLTPLFPWFGPLGAVPLPAKWYIDFGDPVPTDTLAGEPEDPALVSELAGRVRDAIQERLRGMLRRRHGVFRG